MKKTGSTLTMFVIIILALLTLAVKRCNKSRESHTDRTISVNEGDWRHHKLIFTKHARCRMECRDISEDEVEFILINGVINEQKSKEEDAEATGHCPTYALEGKTNDGQQVRIVFGACEKITKVITAIDLGVEHACDCR
ncbi:MAG: DUF4258 domain-containing protein [Bacteroidia bacterium]|nr:DUF4258 domain-containing protein [Bacteroidia bacterium]